MSFFSKLFGGKKSVDKNLPPKVIADEDYKGYQIQAIALKQGSELLLAGNIIKSDGETQKFKQFIRSDRMSDEAQAITFSLAKAKQIIDQQGDHLFDEGH